MPDIIDLSIVESKELVDLTVDPAESPSILLDVIEQATIVDLAVSLSGQKGDTGVVEISADSDNIIEFGTDGKLYAQPTQFKSTQW
tara:strand:- start:308 stop:565 length:258 start_codon:yes stop_codon:yes gene_type:complete